MIAGQSRRVQGDPDLAAQAAEDLGFGNVTDLLDFILQRGRQLAELEAVVVFTPQGQGQNRHVAVDKGDWPVF